MTTCILTTEDAGRKLTGRETRTMHKALCSNTSGVGRVGRYDLHVSTLTMQALRKLSPEDLEVEFKGSYTRPGVKQSTTTKLIESKFIYKYK